MWQGCEVGSAGRDAGICATLSPPSRNKHPLPTPRTLRLVPSPGLLKRLPITVLGTNQIFFFPWTFSNWNSREKFLPLWGQGRVMAGEALEPRRQEKKKKLAKRMEQAGRGWSSLRLSPSPTASLLHPRLSLPCVCISE